VAVEVKVSWAEEAVELWLVERGVDEAPELLPREPELGLEPEVAVTMGMSLK
jgi:hypothetical protein